MHIFNTYTHIYISCRITFSHLTNTTQFVNRFLGGVIDLRGDYAKMVLNRYRANSELDPTLSVPNGVDPYDKRVPHVFRLITHEAEVEMYELAKAQIQTQIKSKRATLAHVVGRVRETKRNMEEALKLANEHRARMQDHRVVMEESRRDLEMWRWLVAERVSVADDTMKELFNPAIKRLARISLFHWQSVTQYSHPPVVSCWFWSCCRYVYVVWFGFESVRCVYQAIQNTYTYVYPYIYKLSYMYTFIDISIDIH
jgi:hypothetical protein